jgi:hypothetical protein
LLVFWGGFELLRFDGGFDGGPCFVAEFSFEIRSFFVVGGSAFGRLDGGGNFAGTDADACADGGAFGSGSPLFSPGPDARTPDGAGAGTFFSLSVGS